MAPTNAIISSEDLKAIVLELLAETQATPRRLPGYELTQLVEERTAVKAPLSFGSLYPILHKMERQGLLTAESIEVNGRLRKYYSLAVADSQLSAS